jgi:D-alanine transaminase
MAGPCPTAYLNGSFLPLAEARVSILDRGFQFADGVYEVIPVYGGRPFRLNEHLRRLERSLAEIRLPAPLTREGLSEAVTELIRRNDGIECQVYIQITRGEAPRNHPFPDTVHPTVVMTCTPMEPVPGEWTEKGVSVITVEDIRWSRCDIKSIALLPNVMMRQRATEEGAVEALWVHDVEVMEGAASNVFAVIDGEARTPPDGSRVLPGITRDVVLELAAAHGWPVSTAPLPVGELGEAEEVWITSSTKEVVPVTRVDGHVVGSGEPGPLFRKVLAGYRDHIRRFRLGEQEDPS